MRPSVNAYREYQANQINTVDQKELIVMLYDGAVRFLEDAHRNLESYKTYDRANENILRTQDILTELMLTLNMDKGGEIAQNLFNLYAFMKKELLEANIEKDTGRVENVIKWLNDLKTSWEQIDDKAAKDNTPPENYRGIALEG